MAYIYPATNRIRIELVNRVVGDIPEQPALTLYGFSIPDIKEESKEYKTANFLIRTDNIGTRQIRKCTFTNNRSAGNSQSTLMNLLGWIPYVKANTHYFKVWPNWSDDYLVDSMESLNCVLKDYFEVKKLHDYLDLGNNITLEFIEMIPDKSYVPKVPHSAGIPIISS